MDTDLAYREKTWRQLHKNVTSYIEQIVKGEYTTYLFDHFILKIYFIPRIEQVVPQNIFEKECHLKLRKGVKGTIITSIWWLGSTFETVWY